MTIFDFNRELEQARADLANARAAGEALLRERDRLIEKLTSFIPEEYEAGEGSAESIIVEYVETVTARLRALVGDVGLARYPEDADGAPLPDARLEPMRYRSAVTEIMEAS